MLYLLLWILTLYVVGFLALPLADRSGLRYTAKVIGLIGLTYIVWLISNIVDFRSAVFYGFLVFVVICSLVWISNSNVTVKFREMVVDYFKAEVVFLAFFLLYLLYTAFDPSLLSGEKMCDMAILNGILKSDRMPPIDVNLAGYRLDCYYYMGYVTYAVLTALSLSHPTVAYNLSCATVFGLTCMLVFRFLAGKEKTWLVLPLLLLAGNLKTIELLLSGDISNAFNFWVVTRVVKGTINEFPLATLMFRDLHPHFMSIPLQLTFLIALYHWIKSNKVSTAVFMAFLLGFLFTVNSWDFFTYGFLLILFAILYRRYYVFALIPLAFVPFLPFHLALKSTAVKGIGFVSLRSSLVEFVTAQPLILLPLAYALLEYRKSLIILLATVPPAVLFDFQILPIIAPVLVVFTYKLVKDKSFESGLIFASALILLLVEIVYVDDAFAGEIERLNTVFKTYVQVWILLSFGCAKLIHAEFITWTGEKVLKALTVGLIAVLWIYPVGCVVGFSHIGFKGTIDGIEFTKAYGEYQALVFLQGFKGVVLEYPGKTPYESYTYAGRVSAYTGLQSVICRGNHELFWRYFNESTGKVLKERWEDVTEIYTAENLSKVKPLLDKYGVNYIYVGYLEKQHYNASSLKKFEVLKKIYDDGNVVVYEYKRIYTSPL